MRRLAKTLLVAMLIAAFGVGSAVSSAGAAGGTTVEEFCTKAVQFQTVLNSSSVDPDDPDSIKAYARRVAKGLKKLAKSAPTAELRKDMKAVAKDYAKVAKSGDLSQNSGTVDEQLRIQDYISVNCTGVVPPSGPTP